jgi:hypothetical protein
MHKLARVAYFVLISAACLLSDRRAAGDAQPVFQAPLFTFDGPDAAKKIVRNNVYVEGVDGSVGRGKALKVRFDRADCPSVCFPAGETPWDWSRYRGLAVDVTNPDPYPVHVCIRVDNIGADGQKNCSQDGMDAPARKTCTLATPFNTGVDMPLWGMRGYPPHCKGDGSTLDPTRVVAFRVFLPAPNKPETLILDNVHLLGDRPSSGPPPSEAFVDRFGQYVRAEWPGKLNNEAEFAKRIAAERADLASHPAPGDRDRYGGWSRGPTREATGWFRTECVNGKWWLITPCGHLFFSLGVNSIEHEEATIVERRDDWFQWLPQPQTPFARLYGTFQNPLIGPVKQGRTFRFYAANLLRKYGTNWQTEWRDVSWQRLQSWGFNTIANWSQTDTFDGPLPYVVGIGIGGSHARVSGGADYWGKMHDVFDPAFPRDVEESVRLAAHLWQGKKMCLGIFVDNELSWGHDGTFGVAVGPLNAPRNQPAKQALLMDLHQKYLSIDRLNAAWRTEWSSWEEMAEKRAGRRSPKTLTDACKDDLNAFIRRFSLKYFLTVRDAIRKTSPHHLYLGCRFYSGNQVTFRAAAEACDVVSFNVYHATVDPAAYAFTNDLGKPCLIGEFGSGATDRGMFHEGMIRAKDQADRARQYVDYVRSVADMPAFVGCHWFEYVDEPVTGRWLDGENYNVGLVSVVDQPYPEMVAAARKTNAEIYERRFNGKGAHRIRRNH